MAEKKSKIEGVIKEIEGLRERVNGIAAPEVIRGDYARVYNSGNLLIGNAAWTALTFDSERWDSRGLHSVVANTGRFTILVPGLYSIGGSALFATDGTGVRAGAIRLNGAAGTYITRSGAFDVGGVAGGSVNPSTQYRLSATDYVEFMVYQNSGGNLNVTASGNSSPEFWIAQIG